MENVRVDVKLIIKWDGWYGAEAMIAKPNFHGHQRLCGKFDRRRNAQTRGEVQQADLRMYVHTGYIKSLFVRISPRVCYISQKMYTDSLIYHIKCDDVYEAMKRGIVSRYRFDMSVIQRITCTVSYE